MSSILSTIGAPLDVSTFLVSDKKPLVYLVPYDKDGNPLKDLKKSFQFWPSEINDSGDPNYSSRNIPGGSVPFYQWVNNADSTISFDTVFSRDLDGVIGGDVEQDQYNVDVAAAISWLKTLKMPHYAQGELHVEPPYTLKLITPGMPVWFGGKDYANVIMAQCSIVYKNWIPDLTSESSKSILVNAGVSLSFNQTVQGVKSIKFPGRSGFEEMASRYTFGD